MWGCSRIFLTAFQWIHPPWVVEVLRDRANRKDDVGPSLIRGPLMAYHNLADGPLIILLTLAMGLRFHKWNSGERVEAGNTINA